jgi:type VI secretion system protein ImpM
MTEAALFGKIPTQGDFVRLNASTPAALAFDAFLQESLEALRRAGGELVPEPVRFAFFDGGSKSGIFGVFAPSQDSVGRSYPLSVFAPLVDATGVAEVPFAARAFLDASADLIAAGTTLSGPDLCARARALEVPAVGGQGTSRRALHDVGAVWLWQTLFPDAPAESAAYALRTLKTACDQVKGKPPSAPGLVLDCPAPNLHAALLWLALVDGRLGWRNAGAPSFFWSASGGGRMLIALGPPPAALLSFLARPDSPSNKLWPLSTAVASARAAAARDLDAGVQQIAVANDGSLRDVVTAMESAP